MSTKVCAALMGVAMIAGCSSSPPIVSADVGCAWTRHIDVSPEQVAAMKRDAAVFRPLAVEIKSHNDAREARCQ